MKGKVTKLIRKIKQGNIEAKLELERRIHFAPTGSPLRRLVNFSRLAETMRVHERELALRVQKKSLRRIEQRKERQKRLTNVEKQKRISALYQ